MTPIYAVTGKLGLGLIGLIREVIPGPPGWGANSFLDLEEDQSEAMESVTTNLVARGQSWTEFALARTKS